MVAARGTRGHGFRRTTAEAMGSDGGTYDLGLPVAEPMTSGCRCRNLDLGWGTYDLGLPVAEPMTSACRCRNL
jgi:hypothetical protein